MPLPFPCDIAQANGWGRPGGAEGAKFWLNLRADLSVYQCIMASRTCLLCILAAPGALLAQTTVHLSTQTNQAFDNYVQNVEARRDWEANPRNKSGALQISPLGGKTPISVPDGLIHDWIASVEIPGATVQKALAVFQDYDHYKTTFAPEVIDSKSLGHEGNVWKAWLRLRRKNVVTVVLDTNYEVEYVPVGTDSWAILSRSTRVTELEDGKALPPGTGNGYLWRLNAYWLLAPRPNGVYLECRSISLSRDIPGALRWLISPMISRVPRDSLQATMDEARHELERIN